MSEFAAWLATWHGALTIGMTTYPALESKLAISSTIQPSVSIELLAKAAIGKPEPFTLQAGVHATVWRF